MKNGFKNELFNIKKLSNISQIVLIYFSYLYNLSILRDIIYTLQFMTFLESSLQFIIYFENIYTFIISIKEMYGY
jgi:hypothetical protein